MLKLELFPKVSLGMVIFLIELFMFITADWLYGPYAPTMKQILLIYIIMQAFVAGVLDIRFSSFREDIITGLYRFGLFFILTAIALLVTQFIIPQQAALSFTSALIGLGVTHALVIAYTEEAVFRDALPKVLGDLWSNVLFGIFHIAMLTMVGITGVVALWQIVFYIVLGLIWAYFKRRYGLSAAWGSHTAYNFGALGLLDKMFMLKVV